MGTPEAELADRVERRLTAVGYLSNGVAAVVVATYVGFFVPGSTPSHTTALAVRNAAVFVPYLVLTLVIGTRLINRPLFAPVRGWLAADRPATADERVAVLLLPQRWSRRVVVPWVGALVLFTAINAGEGARLWMSALVGIVLAAVMTLALQYLLVEQVLRPITALALRGAPAGEQTPGVTARLIMAWTLGAGVPLIGVAGVSGTAPLGSGLSRDRVAGACAVLAVIGVVAGVLAIRLASRSVAEPLVGLRDGLAAVGEGRLDARLAVDDGSEIGRLQAGFNEMINGLRERARLSAAFDTYVDPDLTQRILTEGVDLTGEEVELSVLFLDVRGFTALAETIPPRELVARLNALYGVVVPIITAHGGHASKFIGDGLLAVFGAPERLADHADRAVRCAVAIVQAIEHAGDTALRVGIGVNSGTVVAGTVGGGGRLDFTVIGDAVNTAARVEAATRATGDDVLITADTRRLLDDQDGWLARPAIALKGKANAVTLYAPAR